MKVIGFAGYPGVGKDECARILRDSRAGIEVVAFADPLRQIVSILEGYSPEILKEQRIKDLPSRLNSSMTIRSVLELMGTEGVRELVIRDAWIRLFKIRMDELYASGIRAVIVPDVRFYNEVQVLHDLEGEVYWIKRPGCKSTGHKSSTDISLFCDGVIPNTGSLNDLANTLCGLVECNLSNE